MPGPEDEILSKRGIVTVTTEDFLTDSFNMVDNNTFHPSHNPHGIVNLGTAINCLMEEEVCDKLNQSKAFNFQPHHQHYYDFSGTKELKQTLINLLNRHFQPLNPILPSQMTILTGASSCLDSLAHSVCDPGDVVITSTPVYANIYTDFEILDVGVESLDLQQGESVEESFVLRAIELERKILKLKSEQRRVRAFMLINPQNPLGQVYHPDLLLSLLQVCARHKVHFIVDEIYGLSVFDEKDKFWSVLSLDLPDPDRTHVIWAISKDFGLAGLRVGVVITKSPEVQKCLEKICNYKPVPLIVQQAVVTIFSDTAWCDEVYLPTNRRRLAAAYQRARDRLQGMGAEVRPATAGLFIWFNIKAFMNQLTHKEDLALHQELLEAGVYTVPGEALYCDNPGWMRIVFSVKPQELDIGLDRLEAVLSARRMSKL